MSRYVVLFVLSVCLVACPPPSSPPSGSPSLGDSRRSASPQESRFGKAPARHATSLGTPTSRPGPTSRSLAGSPRQDSPLQEVRRLQQQWMKSGGSRSQSIQPVYQDAQYKSHPLARKLCAAMHTLPAQRKAQCCGDQHLGFRLDQECERNLSIALKIGAIALDPQRLSPCIAALENVYQGCHWVGLWQPPLPAVCLGLMQGKLSLNAPCRSNLECQTGLHCFGLGTTNIGRCYPPLPPGSSCGTGVDALAAFTRQEDVYSHHPMCKDGFCRQYRCHAYFKPGAACRSNIQCGPGFYCNGTICVKGTVVPPGSSCTGLCSPGYRCLRGKCTRLKKAGEPCTSELECEGGCLPVPGTKARRCGMRCRPPIFDSVP